MMKRLLGMLVAILLVFIPVGGVGAQTADVTVNATPAYITISVAPLTYSFGVLVASSDNATAVDYFTITNGSSVVINITIAVVNATWIGGTPWTHAEDATPGADTVGLVANVEGGTWGVSDIIVKNSNPLNLKEDLAASTNQKFGLKIFAPTSFSDGQIKSNVVRTTAAMAP